MTYTPLTPAQRADRTLWRSLRAIVEGATPERLEHLVSVLEVAGPELVEGVRRYAAQAARCGGQLGRFWLELSHLAREVQRGCEGR